MQIMEVETAFALQVGNQLTPSFSWRSYPEHIAIMAFKSKIERPKWTKVLQTWHPSWEIAEHNLHNGLISNFWRPTIVNDKIVGWTSTPGTGQTLSEWQ